MPKASKESASEHESLEGYEGHFEHFDGGWTVGFETYTQDADFSPFLTGLPNDQCQCRHMGYVIKGKVAFRSGDGEHDLVRLPRVPAASDAVAMEQRQLHVTQWRHGRVVWRCVS